MRLSKIVDYVILDYDSLRLPSPKSFLKPYHSLPPATTTGHPRMMQYASQGVRNGARTGSSAFVHHNGPGSGTTANRSCNNVRNLARALAQQQPINALRAIRPRSPPNRLFSASKNLLQRLFTCLTTPGFPVPTYLAQGLHTGTRSFHNAALRGNSIQNRLSFVARASLKNNAMHRQASMFLPRAPTPVPPHCGGITRVGLGTARTFCTGRPIFQQLAENVPIAGRALYEVDWDLKMRKEQRRMRLMVTKKPKKSKEMLKPTQSCTKVPEIKKDQDETVQLKQEFNHYFPVTEDRPVTSYLLIPLAPTPSSRMPLPDDLAGIDEPNLLPPLSYLASLHSSHSTHALRVSTIFTRLDQREVWSRGVHCSAYSLRPSHRDGESKDGDVESGNRVCTILKLTFNGWTEAEVRGVIGESGTGWCVLKEVWHDEGLSDEESLSPDASSEFPCNSDVEGPQLIDPAQSFVLPTLDFSSSFLSSTSQSPELATPFMSSVPDGMESDPWADDFSDSTSLSDSYSDLSDLIIEPPSTNGWFGRNYILGPGVTFSSQFVDARDHSGVEPQEAVFY